MPGKGQKAQQATVQAHRSPGEEQDLADSLENLDTNTNNTANASEVPMRTGPPPAATDPNLWIQLETGMKSPTHGILAWARLTHPDFGLRTTEEPLQLQGGAATAAGFLDAMRNEKLPIPWMGSGPFRCVNMCKFKPDNWHLPEGQKWDWTKGIYVKVNVEAMKDTLDDETLSLCNWQHIKEKDFVFKLKKTFFSTITIFNNSMLQ